MKTKLDWLKDHVTWSNKKDCLIWPFAKSHGYGRVLVYKHEQAHRVMCKLAHGDPSQGQEAAHNCENKLCVNPHHLSWKSHIQNEHMKTTRNIYLHKPRDLVYKTEF